MQLTNDGGFVVTGASTPIGEGEDFVYLLRADSVGNIVWTEAFGNDVEEYGRCIEQCNDGSFIVVGITEDDVTYQPFINLTKISSGGSIQWDKRFGGTGMFHDGKGYGVKQTFDGGFIISGELNSVNNYNHTCLIRTNSNGDTVWTRTYGGNNFGSGYGLQQTADSGFIIAGSIFNLAAGNYDVYIVKSNSYGDTLWTKSLGGTNNSNEEAISIEQTNDGGYIIAGYSSSQATANDLLLIRTDSVGDTLWTRSYGGNKSEVGQDVHQTSDGGFIVAGYSNYSNTDTSDVYIIKTNAFGDTIWTKTYGGLKADQAFSIHQANDGGFLIGGFTQNFIAGFSSAYLIKTDSLGNSGCNELSTPTVVRNPNFLTSSPSIVVSSGAMDSTLYRGIWASGGSFNTICISTNIPSAIENKESGIIFFPNPFNEQISIFCKYENGIVALNDLAGKEIFRSTIFRGETKLNTSFLASGFYLIHYFNDSINENLKVIKQ